VRVVWHFHLVDRHALGRQFNRSTHTILPIRFRFFDHSRNQVDVDLRKIKFPSENDTRDGFPLNDARAR
jgi:hypothetical protein